MEHLAIAIRNNPDIKGIEIDNKQYKLSLYADDLLLHLTSPTISFPSVLKEFEQFGVATLPACFMFSFHLVLIEVTIRGYSTDRILILFNCMILSYTYPSHMAANNAPRQRQAGHKKTLENSIVEPNKEKYWTHVSSDACRLAVIWKYGGIYMDTDIISLRPIPHDKFLAAQIETYASNGVFGFTPSHPLVWQFMENFVKNYRGDKWGQQGPELIARVMSKLCDMSVMMSTNNFSCNNIPYLHPPRFYPIACSSWKRYFEVWKEIPTFNSSYGLHLWNFMNKEHKSMITGSNTLVEHLYQQQCPTTYDFIVRNKKTHL
ncbi:alpha-1,4-N-acetylglucosaminyltransferase-like [Gastrophryne carolinensis]